MRVSKLALGATLFFAVTTTACKGGPEGNYTLDKTEMKKTMEAQVAAMPKEQQGFAKFAVAMVDMMEVSMEIKKGGEFEMTTTKPSLKEGAESKKDTKTGTWKKDGEAIVLTAEGKDTRCTLDGKKLSCAAPKAGDPSMVFNKS